MSIGPVYVDDDEYLELVQALSDELYAAAEEFMRRKGIGIFNKGNFSAACVDIKDVSRLMIAVGADTWPLSIAREAR